MTNLGHWLLALLLAPPVPALRQVPWEGESLQATSVPWHKAEADVELALDEQRRCTRACGCGDNLGFFAGTAAARSLYVGCNSSKPAQQPDLILVGVTKGGTTSFRNAGKPLLCGSPKNEPHYFDFLHERPTRAALQRDYLSKWQGRCGGALTFEKTPAYFFRGAAALRICEALPGQKLALLLRDPVARTWSHYWEEVKGAGSPEDFHERVAMETEVVRRCGGMVLGRPEEDLLAGPRFRECCEEVAGQGWPGCSCERGNRWDCVAPYGLKAFSTVRFSVYAHYLRTWFRYHRASDLLLLFSEDFFADMPGGMCEMHCHAGARRAQQRCSGQPSKDFHEQHANSRTRGREPMLPATRALLAAFFAPYNEELFALVGRRAPWG